MENLKESCTYIAKNIELMVNNPEKWIEENDMDEDCYPISEWMSDALDIELMIGYDGEYRGCRIMVAYGGPNIYVNTRNRQVEGYWWNEHATAEIDSFACDAIDEYMNELRGY